MAKIFDMNNPVWTVIGKMVDVFVLHFFWLLCCIPIVTIGPSTVALYYAMMKDVEDEDPHYVRAFFRSFRANLKQGIPMGLILLVFGLLMAYAFWFYSQMGSSTGGTIWQVMKIMTIVFASLYLFILQYAFPLMARFENTVKQTLKNAFFMSIKNLGWTVVMLAVLVIPYVIIYFTNFLPLFSMAYGLVVFVDSYILNHIFEPFIKAARGDQEEKDPDFWEIPEDVLPGVPEETGENSETGPEESADFVKEDNE